MLPEVRHRLWSREGEYKNATERKNVRANVSINPLSLKEKGGQHKRGETAVKSKRILQYYMKYYTITLHGYHTSNKTTSVSPRKET